MSTPILTQSYYSDHFASRGYQFLRSIADSHPKPKNLMIVSVMHSYEGSLPYVNVLSSISDTLLFVPKEATSKGCDSIQTTVKKLAGCHVVEQNNIKSALKQKVFAVELINKYLKPHQKLLILDHGGYFAEVSPYLCQVFEKQLIGFTELTANGYYKYQDKPLTKPLISVSHLSIKTPADYEASECIVHYSDHILREEFGLKLNNDDLLKIGVIGAGNLGQGVIKHLKGKAIGNLMISDRDPRKLTHFPRNGVKAASVEKLISQCTMLFCCTGSGALPESALDNLPADRVIATVTSADDELNLPKLIRSGCLTEINGNALVKEYRTRNGRSLYLLAQGESANTPFKTGMGDPTLFLFEAAHMLAGLKLLNQKVENGIQLMSESDEISIAQQWLEHFYGYE
ncbi:NAD(P)-binding domain-containing protein [Vibrio sp. SCSIO 43136]|nr:NAD(P)-binding domain-containing protein [Vibrio sp. SCSIO 43136]